MRAKRLFNVVYFLASASVFAWLLHGTWWWRTVPILSIILCGLYGSLLLVSLLKPTGFDTSGAAPVFSAARQRRFRIYAILAPIPAFIYCALYLSCVQFAGEARCLNKFYGPIAKFERASFSKLRMRDFVSATMPKIMKSAERYEAQQDWGPAESYYKAYVALDRAQFGQKTPASFATLGALYWRMGDLDRAEFMFIRAEQLANHRCKLCPDGPYHHEVVSLPHLLSEGPLLLDFDNANVLPPGVKPLTHVSSAMLGSSFVPLGCPYEKQSGQLPLSARMFHGFHADQCNGEPGNVYHTFQTTVSTIR